MILCNSKRVVYYLSVTAMANDHKCRGLKQHKWMGYFKGKAYWEIFRECKVSPGDTWSVSNGLTNGYSNDVPNGSVIQVQDSGLYWTMLGGHMIPGVKHEVYQSRSLWAEVIDF